MQNTHDNEAQFFILLKDLLSVHADEAAHFKYNLLKLLNGFGECGRGTFLTTLCATWKNTAVVKLC